ncbi:T9SS type A sorting domain-containing protein [uncultured Flavobacterium sp.]|uniref:T9SS type A sorting domain-containing protein n=1 Tax=uncultured Flavobacterium sp. TaxID=165435 RepID=UPI0025FB6214|nr:T9SS type A sorting domain-containing protein [uncultured Flavobacterium sp.]
MIKNYFLEIILLTLFITNTSNAQTWQWGKDGGSFDNVQSNEKVESMVTDSDGNVYIVTRVGTNGLQIDGIPKDGYGSIDYMIASFSCSGEYRWSRVIGSSGSDKIIRIQVDAANNIYIAGNILRNSEAYFGSETGIDVTLPYSTQNNEHKQNLFLIKYNSEGEMQWFVTPQAEDVTIFDAQAHSVPVDLQTDPEGNSYWLCSIPTGTYANGDFINTAEGDNYFIFKYNTEGEFIETTALDIQTIDTWPKFKMARNHNTGTLYIGGYLPYGSLPFMINNESISKPMFLAAFNSTGSFLWKKENNHDINGAIEGLLIDNDNSIYLTGGTSNTDTFANATLSSENTGTFPFIIKLDSDGELLWSTNGVTTSSSMRSYAITVNNSEVGITCGHGNIEWDGLSLTAETNTGYDIMLGRFNKLDGSIIGLDKLESNIGSMDYGSAISSDNFGNFYVGGWYNHLLYVGDDTLSNSAQGWDFFIAKYGSNNCDCDLPQPSFEIIPNTEDSSIFNFNYSGTTPYDTISWSFGDETSSSEESPTHTYTETDTYNVCVTVTNACGSEQHCVEVQATALSTNKSKLALVEVYPNPVKDILTITSEEVLNYTIYSVLGRKITNGQTISGQTQLATNNIASGWYFLKLSNNNGDIKTIKLLKQ